MSRNTIITYYLVKALPGQNNNKNISLKKRVNRFRSDRIKYAVSITATTVNIIPYLKESIFEKRRVSSI